MGARKWCQDMRVRNVKTRENGTTMEQHRVGRIDDGLGSSLSACRSSVGIPVSLGI
jgi:hypothetical protein